MASAESARRILFIMGVPQQLRVYAQQHFANQPTPRIARKLSPEYNTERLSQAIDFI
jgi:hypothetical protein